MEFGVAFWHDASRSEEAGLVHGAPGDFSGPGYSVINSPAARPPGVGQQFVYKHSPVPGVNLGSTTEIPVMLHTPHAATGCVTHFLLLPYRSLTT